MSFRRVSILYFQGAGRDEPEACQPLAGGRALATPPPNGFMAIGTPEGWQPLSSLNRLRSMPTALRPLRGHASLLMQARGGAFTLHPWLMASKPPACWKGAPLRGIKTPENCTPFSIAPGANHKMKRDVT